MRQVLGIAVLIVLCLPVAAQDDTDQGDSPAKANQEQSQTLPNAPSASQKESAPPSSNLGPVSTANCPVEGTDPVLAADAPYVPLGNREKFNRFVRTTVDPFTFASAGINATWLQINGEPYSYGGGAKGWGTRFGAKLVDTEVRSFFSQFFFPVILDQDPRYFPKKEGNIFERGWYAATRVLLVRSDNGTTEFNSSYLFSVAASRVLANAYAPSERRNVRNTMLAILGAYGSDAGSYALREFFPDIMRIFRRHAPQPLVEIQEKIPDELLGVPPEAEANCAAELPATESGRWSPARARDCAPGQQCGP